MSAIALNPPLTLPTVRSNSSFMLWATALTVTLATFMELLDTSIANVALPHIAGGLGVSQDESTWVLSSYLVANAVVLPLSAWLSRVFGRKNYYMACVALFTIASVLCGMAPSLGWLIFFRVLQGIGGGGLAPCEQAILVDTFPPAKRPTAFAVYSIAIVAAPAIGPTFGGWLTDTFSWRWCFLINLPVGIISLLLTSRLVHDPVAFTHERAAARKAGKLRIDYIGILLVAVAFGCLEYVLDKGQEDDWFGSQLILTMSIIAAVALIVGIAWEIWGTKDPVVAIQLMKDRNFFIACCLYFLFGFTLFGSTVLLPQMVQQLFGYTAMDAGLVVTPGAIVVMCMVPVAVRIMKITGPRILLGSGFIIIAGSMWMLHHLSLDADYRSIVICRMVQGLGISTLFVPTSTIAYSYLPKNANNKASSLTNLFRNVGGSAGIAFCTTMLQRQGQRHQNFLSANFSNLSQTAVDAQASLMHKLQGIGESTYDSARVATGLMYRQLQTHAQMLAYVDVYAIMFALCLIVPFVLLFVKPIKAGGAPAGAH